MKKSASLMAAVAFGCVTAFSVMSGAAFAQDQKFVTIGTGGVTGVYYPTGGAIARLVNKGKKEHGIRATVESTGGSIYNLNAIRSGELDMGVAQSDWQYHAYHGTSKFEEAGPNKDLRAVFSVHPEPFTVVARADSGVKNFTDLKGKRVNIGNPGSGQRGTMDVVMTQLGWTLDDFKLASELKPAEQSKALCDNKVDAIIYTVGHPNGSIQEATTACDSVLVNVDGPKIEELVAEKDYYRIATIPGGMYRGSDEDTTTFGVGATFVSSANVPEEVIYNVVKAVFENFDQFKKLHPAFANLKKEEMIKDGLSAPLHDGAAKYYKEAGLM
ncbi:MULTISPECIES: TAXI family TRAP transporter solute-binding subunit [Desulfosediminicola]|uniref:TAXI family TRAP transporter solute-binding subunit n=1 Tax=Desulfosediminicola TaxID=2886823 RepID=UPI0010ACE967|nr:TAXI family TRAP transporter solute-binding subunit [Desulfosediminicola ganghwensis]